MTYTAPAPALLPMVSPRSPWGETQSDGASTATPTSATYESANLATYFPIVIPATCPVRRLWWANGATVSASYNVDVGVYADIAGKPGAKLISSGSTAQGTASQVQFVDVTDIVLSPGRYWIAIACSSASATFFRNQSGSAWQAMGKMQEASAFPLPTTATPVEASSTNIYLCGFATTASP